MFCPTPDIIPYLPEEYLNRLNSDYTEFRSNGTAPRSKRSVFKLIGIIQDYLDSFMNGGEYSLLLLDSKNYLSAKNFAKLSTISFHNLNAIGNLAKD